LHAHYAWYLAGGDDPVGRWVAEQLGTRLTLVIGADRVTIQHDADTISLGTGPGRLADGELSERDPPSPAALTNALGAVIDDVDEVLREHPALAGASQLIVGGAEAWHLAQVERGRSTLAPTQVIGRDDIEDLFRTIATERRADRLHNPALDPTRVDTIVATCCVVLGVMRHLHLPDATFVADPGANPAASPPRGVRAGAGC
jgi:exopolyphosphatase/pppGpp-phosphohydrolase